MNILDKVDKSDRPVCGKLLKQTKADHYKWAQVTGSVGVPRDIPKEALNIDGEYQREAHSQGKVIAIARGWNVERLGRLAVMERTDGTLWVVDGGHRTRAAFYRQDVVTLPCDVYESRGQSHEARVYVELNRDRSNASPLDRYKAAVAYGDEIALRAKLTLDSAGYRLARQAKSPRTFKAIQLLLTETEKDADRAQRCFQLAQVICADGPIASDLLKGLCHLELRQPGLCWERRNRTKLRELGQRALLQAIRAWRDLCGHAGRSEGICAQGIIQALNKGRRHKIEW